MSNASTTPRVDALAALWESAGVTPDKAFIEMRDLARELESATTAPLAVSILQARLERAERAPQAATTASARDWTEDYADGENQYECKCSTCGQSFFGHKRRVTCKACAAPVQAAQPALPAIEHDRGMDRTYIPLPGGWEIQTKGKGSSFRIAHVQSYRRWIVTDERLHEVLEALARDVRNAFAAPGAAQTTDKGPNHE